MDGNLLKRMEYRINRRLRGMVPAVNQQEITKNIYGEVEISVGFFTILTLANLIALGGFFAARAAGMARGKIILTPAPESGS
mgnify:CR=1 FL=1